MTAPSPRTGTRPRSRTGLGTVAVCTALAAALACGEAPVGPPSPDSDGLVYLLRSDRGTDIVAVRLSDGEARTLTSDPLSGEPDLIWVPSIQHVVHSSGLQADGLPRLILLDPRDGSQEILTDAQKVAESEASVSLDGKQIAYVFESLGGRRRRGVRLMRAMSGKSEVVAGSPRGSQFTSPSISPDGTRIVAALSPRLETSALWLLEEGKERDPLVQEADFDDTRPRFSHGGTAVWFDRAAKRRAARAHGAAPSHAGAAGGGDVCRVDLETREVRCLAASAEAREHSVEPSPTRDEVAFLRESADGAELVIADESGEELRVVAGLRAPQAGSLRWSPDGERLACAAAGDAGPVVKVFDRRGELVFETPGSGPAWAPAFF